MDKKTSYYIYPRKTGESFFGKETISVCYQDARNTVAICYFSSTVMFNVLHLIFGGHLHPMLPTYIDGLTQAFQTRKQQHFTLQQD